MMGLRNLLKQQDDPTRITPTATPGTKVRARVTRGRYILENGVKSVVKSPVSFARSLCGMGKRVHRYMSEEIDPAKDDTKYLTGWSNDGTACQKVGASNLVWILLIMAVSIYAIACFVQGVVQAYERNPALAVTYGLVLALLITAATVTIIKEKASSRTLRTQDECLASENPDDVRRILSKVRFLEQEEQEAAATWAVGAASCERAVDVRRSFSEQVLVPHADTRVRKLIVDASVKTAILILASPFPVADMIIILTMLIKLSTGVSQIYGVRQGILSRFRMYKYALRCMAVAGAAEGIADMMAQSGAKLVGLAVVHGSEAVIAGRSATKLGICVAMACRPVPFTEATLITYSTLFAEICTTLKERLGITPETTPIFNSSGQQASSRHVPFVPN